MYETPNIKKLKYLIGNMNICKSFYPVLSANSACKRV